MSRFSSPFGSGLGLFRACFPVRLRLVRDCVSTCFPFPAAPPVSSDELCARLKASMLYPSKVLSYRCNMSSKFRGVEGGRPDLPSSVSPAKASVKRAVGKTLGMRYSRLTTTVELALASLWWSGAQERADPWQARVKREWLRPLSEDVSKLSR